MARVFSVALLAIGACLTAQLLVWAAAAETLPFAIVRIRPRLARTPPSHVQGAARPLWSGQAFGPRAALSVPPRLARFSPNIFEEALSCLVAKKGFAIGEWKAARRGYTHVDISTSGSSAMAMGNYVFTTPEGGEVEVEYAFACLLDTEGKVRVNLHRSSVLVQVTAA